MKESQTTVVREIWAAVDYLNQKGAYLQSSPIQQGDVHDIIKYCSDLIIHCESMEGSGIGKAATYDPDAHRYPK